MNEIQWFSSKNPHEMLSFLKEPKAKGIASMVPWLGLRKSRLSVRKQQLFACACFRRIWPLLVDERSRQAIEKCELYVNGMIERPKFRHALDAAKAAAVELSGPRL